MNTHPIAIAIADLHLSLLQPVCRADKDWMGVQADYLEQVKEIADGLTVICAGDIFDRWNAPPELINFALEHLPDGMLCVPGQHDLPNHRMDLMHRSGYGVLKQVGKIRDIEPDGTLINRDFAVHGYGWEQEIKPFGIDKTVLHIAIIHRYVWYQNAKYPGAPESSNISGLKKNLRGYDVAIFGDNHLHWQSLIGGCVVFNCGGFIRRKSDEINYEPSVGIIMSDGTVKRKKLDTRADEFHEVAKQRPEVPFNMKEFIDGLEGLGEHGLDFKAAVKYHLETEDVHPRVKEIINLAIGN